METAKKRAIEAGFSPNFEKWHWTPDSGIPDDWMLFDPLFWQALGKAERWKQVLSHGNAEVGDEEGCTHNECQEWFNHWHSFIDHLASGGDIDTFFKELLKA